MYCTRRSIVRLVARRQEYGLINTLAAVLPTAHVLDHFRFDLVLGQVEGKNGFLPGRPVRGADLRRHRHVPVELLIITDMRRHGTLQRSDALEAYFARIDVPFGLR